jgi:hypothetical protein
MRRGRNALYKDVRMTVNEPPLGSIGIVFLWAIVTLSGCDHVWLDRPASMLDNAQFLETWKAYLHCRASSKPEEIRADLHQLARVAQSVIQQRQLFLSLPSAIRSLVSTPPSRLSVDPQAMTTACALHGSHVAQAAGQPEVSIELLTAAVTAHQASASPMFPSRPGERLSPVGEEGSAHCTAIATTGDQCPPSEKKRE